tara:strand:- start:317 stop:481 length:165 start_codon:yes stop_codon:yes gene_type:complete
MNSFGNGPELYDCILIILLFLKNGPKVNNDEVPANTEFEKNIKKRLINVIFINR